MHSRPSPFHFGEMIMAKRRQGKIKKVEMLHTIKANAAGIDIGATEIYIAVPGDRDPQSVRHFDTFTADLHAATRWLKACGMTGNGDRFIFSVSFRKDNPDFIARIRLAKNNLLEKNLLSRGIMQAFSLTYQRIRRNTLRYCALPDLMDQNIFSIKYRQKLTAKT